MWGTGPGNGGKMRAALENRGEGAERENKGENEVQSQRTKLKDGLCESEWESCDAVSGNRGESSK